MSVVGGADTTAGGAGEPGRLVFSVDPQVAEVRDPRKGLPGNEDTIPFLEGIAEKNQ
jgi:hypothetical protein